MVGLVPTMHAFAHRASRAMGQTWMLATRASMTGPVLAPFQKDPS